MNRDETWKKVGIGAAITGGVILGAALIPITMGFGTAGIVTGSVAAGIQASIGSVVAGSTFAVCTSLGMTGVFATSAAVGAIIGTGGLAAYFRKIFKAKKDAELIDEINKDNDNPYLILKLVENRFPNQRTEIKHEYEKIESSKKFISDILNFIPNNKKEHFENLMKETKEIYPKTEYVKKKLYNKSFDKYFENTFDEVKDVSLINEVMKRNDNPLIIVRLLNYRDESQRKIINDKFMEMKLNPKKIYFVISKNLCLIILRWNIFAFY